MASCLFLFLFLANFVLIPKQNTFRKSLGMHDSYSNASNILQTSMNRERHSDRANFILYGLLNRSSLWSTCLRRTVNTLLC